MVVAQSKSEFSHLSIAQAFCTRSLCKLARKCPMTQRLRGSQGKHGVMRIGTLARLEKLTACSAEMATLAILMHRTAIDLKR